MMRDRMLNAFPVLGDIVIIITAYLMAYYVRFYTTLFREELEKFYPLKSYVSQLVYLVLIYLFSYYIFRLYASESEELGWHQLLRLALSNMVGIILFIVFLYFQKEIYISRKFLLIFFVINTILTIASRILITNHRKLKPKRE